MDHKFTELIRKWLETPANERDYSVGALYLLKLSGNKILYTNIVANLDRRHEVIEYQLQKYYNFRVKELTHDEVEAMQRQVNAIAQTWQTIDNRQQTGEGNSSKVSGLKSEVCVSKGKRSDHDLLPDEIKALYVENLSLLQQMRELHLKLRSLSLENATCPDSERYPFLKEIISLDKKLHSNWEHYDHFVPTAPTATADARPTKAKPKSAASRKKSTTSKK